MTPRRRISTLCVGHRGISDSCSCRRSAQFTYFITIAVDLPRSPAHIQGEVYGPPRIGSGRLRSRNDWTQSRRFAMPVIVVEGEPDSIETTQGRRLVLALKDGGIDILHRCGGNARCTTCRVEILSGDPGPMTEPEAERLERVEDLTPN